MISGRRLAFFWMKRLRSPRVARLIMRDAGCARLSTRAALITAGAEAVVAADDAEAARLFERALALPGAARRTWERARVQHRPVDEHRLQHEIDGLQLELAETAEALASNAKPVAVHARHAGRVA